MLWYVRSHSYARLLCFSLSTYSICRLNYCIEFSDCNSWDWQSCSLLVYVTNSTSATNCKDKHLTNEMPQEGKKQTKSKLAILNRWMKVKGTSAAASETISDDNDSDNNEISNFAGISLNVLYKCLRLLISCNWNKLQKLLQIWGWNRPKRQAALH